MSGADRPSHAAAAGDRSSPLQISSAGTVRSDQFETKLPLVSVKPMRRSVSYCEAMLRAALVNNVPGCGSVLPPRVVGCITYKLVMPSCWGLLTLSSRLVLVKLKNKAVVRCRG